MTEPKQAVIPLTEIPISQREQAKADILESYLVGAVSHTPEALTMTLTTTMKVGEEKLYAIALLQILQRLHIETVKVSALIIHGVLAEAPFHEAVSVPWHDEGQARTVRLVSRNNDITLTVTGTLPKEGKNGQITHNFFDQGSDAGKILSDGRIDFRELLRYPSVKAGDRLLRVVLPEAERNGLSPDGSPIQANPAKEYPIKLGNHVEKIYTTTEDGRPGYDVNALKEGVVITQMGPEGIAAIDVTDRIVLGEIDFSVGNIGSDVVCPVSMQAESVNAGFSVKVAGSVTIRTIAGGEVTSGKNAAVDQILPGSLLTAGGDLSCRRVASSTLSSEGGTLSIQREALDATLNAHRVEMNTAACLLLNTRINASAVDMKNVRISGTNHLILGTELFALREGTVKERQKIATAHGKVTEALNKAKASFVEQLKGLSAAYGEDPAARPVFKHIVDALKAYDFETASPLLASLKRSDTCLVVNGALRTMERVQRLHPQVLEGEARIQDLDADITAIEAQLEAISFSIDGRLRPSAVVAIHLGENDATPLILDASPGNGQDHAVSIRGKFTLDRGLITSQRSR